MSWFPLDGCCSNCPQYESEKAYRTKNENTMMICCPQCPYYETCQKGIKPSQADSAKKTKGLAPRFFSKLASLFRR